MPLEGRLTEGSLVLYKQRPARVRQAGDKLELELEGGESARVRPKDVLLLHPGPLRSLADLRPPEGEGNGEGEVQAAWELLLDGQTTLPELAELAYGAYTPASAWAAWQLLADGLYFRGTPDAIVARTPGEVAERQAARAAEAAEKQAWAAFVEHLRAGRPAPEDGRYLEEVEALALGQREHSRVLRELGREETPEKAHALLLEVGHWDETVNPYPVRFGLVTSEPQVVLPDLADEPRVDLTHLPAFAIDDAGTTTPDDALSLEGNRLWVHVADAAALVCPGSPADLEARARGSSLHLPEGTVPMLPPEAVRRLGLGLNASSPALSFGLELDAEGQIVGTEVVLSRVRVTRLTYDEAERLIAAGEEPFLSLHRLARRREDYRRARGGVFIERFEVRVDVQDGQVDVSPLPALDSRITVQEAMIAAGEAAARLASEQGIPFPFSTQEASDLPAAYEHPSDMFALRRLMRRSQYKTAPAPHAGLGLPYYTQATSPLRRYLDLVAHQQLRAHLHSGALLDTPAVLERIGAVEAVTGALRRAEQRSERHWTLVYLLRHPGWQGEAVVLEKRGLSATVVIPALGLEAQVHLPADVPLDSTIRLQLQGVDLAHLATHFRVVT